MARDLQRPGKLSERYTVRDGERFRLKNVDPDDDGGVDKHQASDLLKSGIERLRDLQERLYAEGRWGVLLIFQAMDAAGKDSAIEHVMSGVNPQGCDVHAFKQPTLEDLNHDFLWRCAVRLPARGRIGIFNRSHYEEVLIVRVHPSLLQNERLPRTVKAPEVWTERYEDINAFERHLARSGFVIRKFFLHISRKEQTKRFEKRLDEPAKRWKFSLSDLHEQRSWPAYMKAYERAIRETAAPHAPWLVIPANHKWFARLVVADAIVSALQDVDPQYPELTAATKRGIAQGREMLRRVRKRG